MNGIGASLATKLSALVDCLCAGLSTEGGGDTCWCGVFPGAQVAWDYCGECSGSTCGMGYVRVERLFSSSQFPLEDAPGGCGSALAAEVRVGALRCLPVADAQGALPDEESMLDAALAVTADASAIYQAIACCDVEYAIGGYQPFGPVGGCVGGEWTMWVVI